MARGVDDLVNHVLSEIALTGVQGMHDSHHSFRALVLLFSKLHCNAMCLAHHVCTRTPIVVVVFLDNCTTPLSPDLAFESQWK